MRALVRALNALVSESKNPGGRRSSAARRLRPSQRRRPVMRFASVWFALRRSSWAIYTFEDVEGQPTVAALHISPDMRVASLLSVVTLLFAQTAVAANAFAGSNLYYAAGLTQDERTTLLK